MADTAVAEDLAWPLALAAATRQFEDQTAAGGRTCSPADQQMGHVSQHAEFLNAVCACMCVCKEQPQNVHNRRETMKNITHHMLQ